jgi:P-type Cu2+ transporter
MSTCVHCGTPFSASSAEEKFCCHGCEFVYELIQNEGLDRFYDLRRDTTVRPVRSVPFEAHDFSWLEKTVEEIETKSVRGKPVEADFLVEGLSCVGCVWLVEKVYLRQAGALEAVAHPATGHLHLRWTSGETDLPAFAREIASFGYSLSPHRKGASHGEARQLGVKLGLCGAFAMNAMVFTLPRYVGMPVGFSFAAIFQLIAFLSAMLAMLVGGSYFIRRAWIAVKMGSLHMDLPIALGLILAFTGSLIGWALEIEGLLYFDFVATFVFLMLGGRFLQISAIEKNRNRLQRQRPVPETLRSPDGGEPISLSELAPGLRFELLPGQSVPVSSVLDSKAGDFSLEWINGEADPNTFHAGRPLPAGAIYLGNEPIFLTAGETWEDSLLARLTSTYRAPIRVPGLEKLLRIYLFAVLLIGSGGFVWWLYHGTAASALQVMISVFVVSCPCALGVALPFADELAGSLMERSGVFIRESLLWSRLRKVKTILFDKTGTLTLERPVLANPESLENLLLEARLALARLTTGSLHPVSRSLLESLGHEGQRLLREHLTPDIQDVPGAGRFFEISQDIWSLGRPGWQPGFPLTTDSERPDHDSELRKNGETVARFCFHESLRPDAIAALQSLRAKHFRLVILSGDRPEKVSAAAKLLGISEEDAHAALQPADKENYVKRLDRHDTLYLGDGANDSLAFNAAWTTGTPVVDRSLLESKADFYFLGHGLRFLPQLLALAKRRQQAVHLAFAFALVYNFCAIAAALTGHMNPLVAAIIMPLSSAISLAIVGFGLRDVKKRSPKVALFEDLSYSSAQGNRLPEGDHDQRSKSFRAHPV